MKKTGRPRIDDSLLKHPRSKYKRKSNHVSEQLDIPEPSEREKDKWAPIARLCWELVVTNPSSHVASKKNMVDIRWPNKGAIPEDFPRGRRSPKQSTIGESRRYNAEAVLMWLWERRLVSRSVSDIYKLRASAIASANGELNIGNGLLLEHDISTLLKELDVD